MIADHTTISFQIQLGSIKHSAKQAMVFCLVTWLLAVPASPTDNTQTPTEPPAPKPSAAVQKVLDEVDQFTKAKQPQDALKAGGRALAAAGEAADRIGEALAHRVQAQVLQSLGQTEEAVAAWRAAAAAWAQAGDGPGCVEALATAGLLLAQKPEEAKALIAEALALGRAEAKRPQSAALALHGAGLASYNRRRLSEAREFWMAALAIWEKLAPDSLNVAKSLNNLGILASSQGDQTTARAYFQRVLTLLEKLAPDSLDVAKCLNNLGNTAYHQDLTAARAYFQRALALREKLAPDSLDMASSLGNLGGVAGSQGDLTAARAYFQRALALQEKLAPNSLDMAMSLSNLGYVAYRQRDLTAARAYHQQGLVLWEKLAPDSPDVARNLNYLGLVAYQQGDLTAAQVYHQRALTLREKLAPDSLDVAASLDSLGGVAASQRELAEAERWAQRAWQLIRQQAAAVTGDEARQEFGSSTADYAAHLIRYQLALGKVGTAFITLEEGRAQALQQLLLERAIIAAATNDKLWPEYQAAVTARDRAGQVAARASVAEALARRDLTAQQEAHAAPDLSAKAQAAVDAARKKLKQAQSAYIQARVQADQLWVDIKKNAPRVFAEPLTLEQGQKVLPAGTLFVVFSVGEEQTHVFLLPSGTDPASSLSTYTINRTQKDLEALVRRLKRTVSTPSTDRSETVAAGRALFAKLFSKEARAAIHAARRLLISPDGPLWEVPFAALVMNADTNKVVAPQYLGLEKPITYTQSLAVFAQSRGDAAQLRRGSQPYAVVVGDPIFDRRAVQMISAKQNRAGGERSDLCFGEGKPADPLPGTKAEASRIAEMYNSTLLIKEEATEAALRQRIGTADVIHLATHGCPHPMWAMSSGVLLTVPEKEPDIGETNNDGVLQAWEIHSQLKLKAELVVLSACETGRGQNVRAEGIIGLIRSLQYAGARSVVASQWQVNDQSTATLMVAFHRNLRKGLAKDEALRQAMTRLRHQNRRTAHPYYWAPFFLTGDPDNPNLGANRLQRNPANGMR